MKEEKIKISVNQEDVQNIIDCYEKDIEYIKHLEEENKSLQFQLKAKEEVIKEAREYIYTKVISNGEIIDQLRKIEVKKLLEILSKGENK